MHCVCDKIFLKNEKVREYSRSKWELTDQSR